MRKWGYKVGRFYFSGFRKALDVQIFQDLRLLSTNAVPEKGWTRKLHEGRRDKINAVSKTFNFCKNNYICIIRPRTPTFWPGQYSLALSILVRWWQTRARWNCDTKGSLILAIYQGVETIAKIVISLWQTNSMSQDIPPSLREHSFPARSSDILPRSISLQMAEGLHNKRKKQDENNKTITKDMLSSTVVPSNHKSWPCH